MNEHHADPRAETLLSGTPQDRLAFKLLAALLASRGRGALTRVAQRFDVSRQAVYQALVTTSAAGYTKESTRAKSKESS